MRNLDDVALQSVTCARCEAKPGQRCITLSGKVSTRLHSIRTRAVYEAWRIGWSEGITIILDFIERECDPDRADLEPRETLERTIKQARTWVRA